MRWFHCLLCIDINPNHYHSRQASVDSVQPQHTRNPSQYSSDICNGNVYPSPASYNDPRYTNANHHTRMRSPQSPQMSFSPMGEVKRRPHNINAGGRMNVARPAAPPSYELVRGNPPPPSQSGRMPTRFTSPVRGMTHYDFNKSQVGYHNLSFPGSGEEHHSVSPSILNDSNASAFSEVRSGAHKSITNVKSTNCTYVATLQTSSTPSKRLSKTGHPRYLSLSLKNI